MRKVALSFLIASAALFSTSTLFSVYAEETKSQNAKEKSEKAGENLNIEEELSNESLNLQKKEIDLITTSKDLVKYKLDLSDLDKQDKLDLINYKRDSIFELEDLEKVEEVKERDTTFLYVTTYIVILVLILNVIVFKSRMKGNK